MPTDPRAVLSRPAPPPDLTVAYGGHPDQVADVRVPPGTARASRANLPPLVMFLHGGFWRHEYDRAHAGPLATDLARRGLVVATLEYRRTGAPGGGWPGTFEDVAAAVRVVPALVAARTPVDLGRVVLAGHSAGGQLALWAAAGLVRDGVATWPVVALAPVADLRAGHDLDLDGGAVAALLGGGPADVPGRYAEADPVALVPVGTRVRAVHGSADRHVPVELSRRFIAAAQAAGDDANLVELVGVEHFAVIDPESSAWPAVLAEVWAALPGQPPR